MYAQNQPAFAQQPQYQEIELELAEPSNHDINDAGDFLRTSTALSIHPTPPMLLLISSWRSSHVSAMKKVMLSLKRHAKTRQTTAIISGRAKRMRSIASKLVRQPTMTLSTMQDIAGCRAVLDDIESAESFAESIRLELAHKLSPGSEIGGKNYIETPKPDGYRSIHFVVRYKHQSIAKLRARRVEIQIRSLLQHQWATALETVDLFTGQTLKIGGGDIRWRRFFALSSSIFAHQEKRPFVPGMPESFSALILEMKSLAVELRVVERLQGWSRVMNGVLDGIKTQDTYVYLVELDVDANTTHVRPYAPFNLKAAYENYLSSEMKNENVPNRSTVLVSAYSLDEVREAFPGYYGDTKAFLQALQLVL